MKNLRIGVPDVIFIVFLILKLAGLVAWSWWWIFSPYLIAIPLYIFIKMCD